MVDRIIAAMGPSFPAELSAKLDKLDARLTDRMLEIQQELRQRNDDLRKEVLTLSAWLDDKIVFQLALIAVINQINPWVHLLVAYLLIIGHVGAPFLRIIPLLPGRP